MKRIEYQDDEVDLTQKVIAYMAKQPASNLLYVTEDGAKIIISKVINE